MMYRLLTTTKILPRCWKLTFVTGDDDIAGSDQLASCSRCYPINCCKHRNRSFLNRYHQLGTFGKRLQIKFFPAVGLKQKKKSQFNNNDFWKWYLLPSLLNYDRTKKLDLMTKWQDIVSLCYWCFWRFQVTRPSFRGLRHF